MTVVIDRPLGSVHPKHPEITYPVNYGYIPGTLSGDNEELDAYVLGVDSPITSFEGQCIAVIHRTEEDDDKLIIAPPGMNFSDEDIMNMTGFIERFYKRVIFRKVVTERFSGRAQNYALYRPSYPHELIELLKKECQLKVGQKIADVGSGTGILTELLLKEGAIVTGIEPNDEMRSVAEKELLHYSHFKSLKGTAEKTTLQNQSVELITVAQAFHWFDPVNTRIEFDRIIKPSGHIALIWNLFKEETDFGKDYETFMQKHGTDYKNVKENPKETEEKVSSFFNGKYKKYVLMNFQELDFEGFKGRFLSTSFAPLFDDPDLIPALEALKVLFNKHQLNGVLRIPYDTLVYLGQ